MILYDSRKDDVSKLDFILNQIPQKIRDVVVANSDRNYIFTGGEIICTAYLDDVLHYLIDGYADKIVLSWSLYDGDGPALLQIAYLDDSHRIKSLSHVKILNRDGEYLVSDWRGGGVDFADYNEMDMIQFIDQWTNEYCTGIFFDIPVSEIVAYK